MTITVCQVSRRAATIVSLPGAMSRPSSQIMSKNRMFQSSFASTRTPPIWPFLVICAVVGSVVSLGTLHRSHCSDTLIPILVSLQKWTPFFWEQDRVGMLVPLLTLPLRNPFLNLLAQGAIYV